MKWTRTTMRRFRFQSLPPLVLVLFLMTSACGSSSGKLTGTSLDKTPAPDFTLTDQRGQPVTLSSLRGHAVVLTFIYTNCTDICPLIAEKLRAAYQLLTPSQQQEVIMLAITVDPARDDQAALQKFSEAHSLADMANWHALTGDPSTLSKVWSGYYIDASGMINEDATPLPGATQTALATPDNAPPAHTDAIFLIDKDGNERVLLRSTIDYKEITGDLKILSE